MRRWASDSSGGEQDGQGRRQEPGGVAEPRKLKPGSLVLKKHTASRKEGQLRGVQQALICHRAIEETGGNKERRRSRAAVCGELESCAEALDTSGGGGASDSAHDDNVSSIR